MASKIKFASLTFLFSIFSGSFTSTGTASIFSWSLLSKNNAKVEALVNQSRLDVLKNLINLIDFNCLWWIKKLVDKVGYRNHTFFFSRLRPIYCTVSVILFTDHIKQEFKDIAILSHSSTIESLNKLFLPYISITLVIYRDQSLL